MRHSRLLSLAYLTVDGAHPIEQIEAARANGFDAVGLRLQPPKGRPLAHRVIGDAPLLKSIRETCAALNVSVLDIELISLDATFALTDWLALLETSAAIGAKYVQVVCEDADHVTAARNLAMLASAADAVGLQLSLEFMRFRSVRTLHDALAVIERSGVANVKVLVDVLHLDRSGGSAAALAAIDPSRIAYVQLCDAPAQRPVTDQALLQEARNSRLYPGEGALPLQEILAALPMDLPVSLETPHAAFAQASVVERARRAGSATRDFFSQAAA